MFKLVRLLAVVFFFTLSVHAQYAGRYTDGKSYAVYFEQTKHGLTVRPVMWTATQLLRQIAKDKFEVVDRTSRGADFHRDDGGRVVGVTIRGMDGEGLALRRAIRPLIPLELLLAGKTRAAADAYIAAGDTARALIDAEQILNRIPTMRRAVSVFLEALAPHFQNEGKFHTLLGYAYVASNNRAAALNSFQRAYRLDPANENAVSGLARLKAATAKTNQTGWQLRFPLASVFAKPTTGEIAAVERDWALRDLRSTGIKEELQDKLEIAGRRFNVRIVSHLIHGRRHYGAIISPENMRDTGSLPVIIEAKGVSPTYFPLDLTRLASPRFMGDRADEFVYVVPSFRGEVLNFRDKIFTSEGDRTDALDGATDDTIALLNVAIETTPVIDPARICAFGHSRGGTVAMLAGIRDRRIDCVVNWAGPTDWFYAMGTNGWTEEELWAEALRTRATTQQTGGQNVERFLKRAIEGNATLQDVRRRMIASSPLYFAHRLPRSQHHYGIEDPSVPVRNGRELVAHLRARGIPAGRYQAFFYPGQGHDTDRLRASIASREFIAGVLRNRGERSAAAISNFRLPRSQAFRDREVR